MTEKILALTLPGNAGNDLIITPPAGFITTGENGLTSVIQWVIIILGALGVATALIFLIWGAIKWITSSGDKEKLQSARATITYSIIGLIIVLLSAVIIGFVGRVLNGKDTIPDSNSRLEDR